MPENIDLKEHSFNLRLVWRENSTYSMVGLQISLSSRRLNMWYWELFKEAKDRGIIKDVTYNGSSEMNQSEINNIKHEFQRNRSR